MPPFPPAFFFSPFLHFSISPLTMFEIKSWKEMLADKEEELRQAQPPWANKSELQAFYKACPPDHHVNHVIPLNNPIVCGLHCIENLQYLPAQENKSKSNYFDPKNFEKKAKNF